MRLSELGPFLDRKRDELMRVLGDFGPDEYELKEHEQGWTVTEVVEHLCIVEALVYQQAERMLAQAEWTPAEPEDEKIVDIRALLREKGLLGTKKQAPAATWPTGKLAFSEALQELSALRVKLEQLLPALADRGTNGIVAVHPLGLELNVCQWILFSAYHEWAHIHQLRRIRAANPNQG